MTVKASSVTAIHVQYWNDFMAWSLDQACIQAQPEKTRKGVRCKERGAFFRCAASNALEITGQVGRRGTIPIGVKV
jgi:hypothetical protein